MNAIVVEPIQYFASEGCNGQCEKGGIVHSEKADPIR
jgi:hypothetical protein